MSLTPILSPNHPQISGRNYKRQKKGPQTPQRDLLNTIFNNQEEKTNLEKAQGDQVKYRLLATALHGSTFPPVNKDRKPPGPCFKCGKDSHWALMPKPRPPPGPCPSCGIKGHWKVNCPNPPPGIRTSPPGPEQESSDPALPSLLGLAAEN